MRLKLELFGESHAPEMSFKLENFPSGQKIDFDKLRAFMARRSPGQSTLVSSRRETDEIDFGASLTEAGETTGGTIIGVIKNSDCRPQDYAENRAIPRPGHADYGQWVGEGKIAVGGGANSGRMTALLCAAGGVCLQYLEARGILVRARLVEVHGKRKDFEAEIERAQAAGDSVGGVIECETTGLPAGIGGALFDGVETALAGAAFAIPGVNGIEFGNGFGAAKLFGSENNDPFAVEHGRVVTTTNNQGGLLGGRTTGMPLIFRVAMKPTPTIFQPQQSVDLTTMTPVELKMKGRHDPCIALRAVPVVEAITGFVLTDYLTTNH